MKAKKLLPILVLCCSISLFSCKKDKGDSSAQPSGTTSAADILAGTYSGKLTLYPGGTDYFDAVIIVTKEGDKKVRIAAKTGTDYAHMTPKSFTLRMIGNDVASEVSAPEGQLSYNSTNKAIILVTEDQSETDVTATFNGTKK